MTFLDEIPEKSYGIIECLIGTALFSIFPIIAILCSINSFILFLYYSVVLFMIFGFAAHIRSHDVTDTMRSLISKADAAKKEIDKYAKNNKL
jgi:uncharacterized metal-binding protein